MKPKKIVIVGAGFAGVYLARHLAEDSRKGELEITLVSKTNHFLFTPLLHEVATGGLGPLSVAEPLREIFAGRCVRILQGEVAAVDASRKIVKVGVEELPYDFVAVTTGSESNYYGTPGAKEFSLPLKTLEDAARIRSRVIDAFEKAALASSPGDRAKMLSFVVVGGGATGVELAAEMIEFVEEIGKRYFPGKGISGAFSPKVTLINAGPQILMPFHPKLREYGLRSLRKHGITVMLDTAVKEIFQDGILLGDGSRIDSETVIWAAGIAAAPIRFEGFLPELTGGRIAVDQFLRAKGGEGIYALGDVAAALGKDGKPLPTLAQVAVAEAKAASENILAEIRSLPLAPFAYFSKGTLVSLGKLHAAGEMFGIRFSGMLAWFAWRTVYYFKFNSWKKRSRISFDWAIDLIYPRDITKLK